MAACRIGILIFDGVEEMDFAGPWEVFQAAVATGPPAEVFTVAERRAPVVCEKGLRVLPDRSFDAATELDLLLIPGGSGARREAANPVCVDWIRTVAPGCRWIASVCTGTFLLVAAGPGQGRRVTTHHRFLDALRAQGAAQVVEGQRMVCDGNVVSSGGVMSGIEMSLWLVERMLGPAAAAEARDYIAYDFPPRGAITVK
jgi:transcriptional regulator GlxA family with amidase domain